MLVKRSNQLSVKRVTKQNSEVMNLKMVKLEFVKDFMKVFLIGGRVLLVPLSKFPEIKNLSSKQRNDYHISGGIALDFEDCDEVYHLNELIGIQ
jgi:hypothetical protein